jgi:hypothetical protein
VSQLLTLYITPVIFVYFSRLTARRAPTASAPGLTTEPAVLAK